MKIEIKYNSCWDGSFLEKNYGKDNFNKNTKFIGTSKYKGQFPRKDLLSINTIYGILYRLVGEQRRLFQIENDYLNFLRGNVTFKDINSKTKEIVNLKNLNNSDNPSGRKGIPTQEEHPFFGRLKTKFLFPLFASFDELEKFILTGDFHEIDSDIKHRFDLIKYFSVLSSNKNFEGEVIDLKKDEYKERLNKIFKVFKEKLPNVNYKEKDFTNYSIIVFSSLYLMSNKLEKKLESEELHIFEDKNKKWNKGISPRGVTIKDFISSYVEKNTVINSPTLLNSRDKNKDMLTKKDGTLTIDLKISRTKAISLKEMIDNASVGSFSIGKKGLAYVSKIEV